MCYNYIMIVKNEQEMLEFGRDFVGRVRVGVVIELIGDVGAGKTTFVRGLADGLGIKEQVTSPSFTISKAYAMPEGGELIHYDFYRLQDPGIMVEDLKDSINENNIVIIEWGESVAGVLPEDRIKIKISYNDDNSRTIEYN